MADYREFALDEVLRDGGSIRIRAIRPDDKQRLLDSFHRLSPRSVHMRFFGAKRRLTDAELVRFTEVDFDRNVGLIATLGEGDAERIIGVGRYMATAARRAEVAFVVDDEHQGRGVGTVLLDHLAVIARDKGIDEFEADVLGENNQMLRVFRKSGFVVRRSIESGVVHLSFPTQETEEHLKASLERDIRASAESVRHFLEPASIAVVTGDDAPDSLGGRVLANLRASFRRPLFAVVPGRAGGREAAYDSLAAIPQPVELVVIAVPAAEVTAVVDECSRAGVRAVLVLSAGFAEASERGRSAQVDLARRVRQAGMRLVGPNCLGILNNVASMNATTIAALPPPGRVAMLAQGVGVSAALLDHSRSEDLGLSSFVSVGNKADVSGNDLLSYWMLDEATSVIALYLESFGNPRHFARIAPKVGQSKPIVALKAGRSGERERAASGRAGRLADVDIAVGALFEQAGVIRADTIEDLFGVLSLLSSQPLPHGNRVAIVTNAGGPALLLADACASEELEIVTFDPMTADALRGFCAEDRLPSNPLDLGAAAGGDAYEKAVGIVGADACVDAVIAVHIPSPGAATAAVARGVARGAAAVPAGKPVLTVFIAGSGTPPEVHMGARGKLAAYRFPENAALALASAARYARWRRRPLGAALELDRTSRATIRAVIERVRGSGGGWLDRRDAAMLMRAAGIQYIESQAVSPADAADFAETLAYPLVAKASPSRPGPRHEKSATVLGLRSRDDVARAVEELRRAEAARGEVLESVLLQREYASGIEAVAGVTLDPLFGPLLVCGLGRVLVDIVRDLAVRLTPLTDVAAAEMVGSLRAARLLEGYRHIAPGDRVALEDLLMRLSALVETAPEIVALDLDPMKILAPGEGVVVLDAQIRI